MKKLRTSREAAMEDERRAVEEISTKSRVDKNLEGTKSLESVQIAAASAVEISGRRFEQAADRARRTAGQSN